MINPSGYLDGNTHELKDRMKHSYDAWLPKWQGYWQNANIDRRYTLGDQRYLNYFANPYYKEQKFIFNIIHAKIQQVLGVQRKGRKSSVVVPSNMGSDQTASQLTKVLMWVMAEDNMLEKVSTAFYNALVTGLSLMQVWRDDRDDPFSGNLKIKNYASSAFIMDPWWQEMDLSDCQGIWTRDYLSLIQLQTMMPDMAKEIAKMKPSQSPDIRFSFMPESYQVKYRSKQNYAMDDYFYAAERERTMIHHLGTRQAKELPSHIDLDDFMMNEVPEDEREYIEVVKQTIPSVRRCISVADNVIYDEHYGDKYDFIPVVCYMDPESIEYSYRFQGLTRKIRDTQYLFNRRTQIQLDTLESLPTSGINVLEDALIDEQDAFKTGAGQVRVVDKKYAGTGVGAAIQDIQPPRIDATAFQMTENLSSMSGTILGINEALMAEASDNDVGIIEILRQGSALTTLQTVFDNIDLSQKILSERLIDHIQKDFSIGKIAQILGEEPSEEFQDKAFFQYNCVVEDGLNTTTQKQMQFAQLMQLAALPKIGDVIDPQDIFEAATIQNKDKIMANAAKREEMMQQQQQAQAQAQMQQMQVQTELFASQSDLNRAGGDKNRAQSADYQASAMERLSGMSDSHALAEERRAEALKKLDEIDLNQLDKLISILGQIGQANNPQEAKNGTNI